MESRPDRRARLTAAFALLLSAAAAPAADAPLELVQTLTSKGKAGNLDHLALDAKHGRLFLANKANNTLDVFDLKEGKLLKQVKGQAGVQGLAYAADLDRLFAALGTDGLLNVFDGDYKVVNALNLKDDADNVCYVEATKLVYVAHADKALAVVDAKTYEKKADVKLPASAEDFVVEQGRPRLYVNCPEKSEVTVIDTDKNEITAHYPVKKAGENVPMALDEANHRLFVGCRKEPMLVVMDTETGKEVAAVEIPGGTDNVHYDAKRKQVYATCGAGFVAVVRQKDADHYEAADKVATAKGAKTSYFDADTGRLYVAVPRQEDKEGPEVRIYQAKP
jgi:DNA-binding beta-propeller fold protein YncE